MSAAAEAKANSDPISLPAKSSPETSASKPNMSSAAVLTETTLMNNAQAAESSNDATLEAPVTTKDACNEAQEEPRSSASENAPLPADLKRILGEVARTGACSWLAWSTNDAKDKDGQSAPLSAASSAAELTPASPDTINNGGKAPASAAQNINSNTKYALGLAIPSSSGQSRRPYHYPSGAAGSVPKPARKKHKNGLKVGRRRIPDVGTNGSKTQTGTTSSKKRPLFLIRASAPASGGASSVFSPGSVGSGRTSGSEPDDSTQYECDSEGTSATSCSELSVERRDHHLRNIQRVVMPASKKPPAPSSDKVSSTNEYHCLRDAFRMALGLVLDYWFCHRGGYKLSPAERRRSDTLVDTTNSCSSPLLNGEAKVNKNTTKIDGIQITTDVGQQQALNNSNNNSNKNPARKQSENDTKKSASLESPELAEEIFNQRRQRLLTMLGQTGGKPVGVQSPRKYDPKDQGPPFTIQRIAEVLIAPERYYTQTHKLCNCLEKLLLVTSSTSAFGGSTGGVTSQSRLEERELAALADEKGRLESEFRQRALKRRCSSLSDDLHNDGSGDSMSRAPGSPMRDENDRAGEKSNGPSAEKKLDNETAATESSSREMLEAAARSLRTKFDHVGIDPHSSAVANRDVRSIAENRGMTNSPPPPSLAMSAAAASNIALPGHTAVGTFVRQHLPEQNADHPSIARVPSPILFTQGNDSSAISPLHAAPNMHGMLHMHHASPLAGVSMGATSPFDVVTIQAGGAGASAPGSSNLACSNEGGDLEGRSSASNSDVDSESDDVSFDDSASDRSDGSDSGHYEPFTAARAMALNRIQQQQRLQSRVLTSLALHQNEGGFRPPADSEYQSGDSIDSTRGEDSGGSDSSSSDVAD